MATAKAKRTALATAIATEMGSGWAVYAAPPETVSAPAVVIGPRSPYREQLTPRDEKVNLQVTILVQRASGAIGLDVLDDAIDSIRDATLAVADQTGWLQVSQVGITQEVGGVEMLTATIDIYII